MLGMKKGCPNSGQTLLPQQLHSDTPTTMDTVQNTKAVKHRHTPLPRSPMSFHHLCKHTYTNTGSLEHVHVFSTGRVLHMMTAAMRRTAS